MGASNPQENQKLNLISAERKFCVIGGLLTSLITLARFQASVISRVENAVGFPLEVS